MKTACSGYFFYCHCYDFQQPPDTCIAFSPNKNELLSNKFNRTNEYTARLVIMNSSEMSLFKILHFN